MDILKYFLGMCRQLDCIPVLLHGLLYALSVIYPKCLLFNAHFVSDFYWHCVWLKVKVLSK